MACPRTDVTVRGACGTIPRGWEQENTHSEMDRNWASTMGKGWIGIVHRKFIERIHQYRGWRRGVISGPVGLERLQHPDLTCISPPKAFMEILGPVEGFLTLILWQVGHQPFPTVLGSFIDHRCPPWKWGSKNELKEVLVGYAWN